MKVGVPMPILGGEDKYGTSSILFADCKLFVFKAKATSPRFESLLVESSSNMGEIGQKSIMKPLMIKKIMAVSRL